MKVLEGSEEVLKVYIHPHSDTIIISNEDVRVVILKPLDAQNLRDLLTKLIAETEYFKNIKEKAS